MPAANKNPTPPSIGTGHGVKGPPHGSSPPPGGKLGWLNAHIAINTREIVNISLTSFISFFSTKVDQISLRYNNLQKDLELKMVPFLLKVIV